VLEFSYPLPYGAVVHDGAAGGRAGVQFTAEQKAQIEVLQESGDIAGAQAVILKELETRAKRLQAIADLLW